MAQGSDVRWQGQIFPQIQVPFVDERGQITRPWLQLLIGLWTHTNGGQDTLLGMLAFGDLEEGGDGTSSSSPSTSAIDALLQADPQGGQAGLRQATIAGTTAGTATLVMPFRDPFFKIALGYFAGYRNSTASPQTWTFPNSFQFAPYPLINIGPDDCSVSATTLTLPISMSAAETGWVVYLGF